MQNLKQPCEIAYSKYDVGFKNSKGESDEVQIKVKKNDYSIPEEKIDLINQILKLSKEKDIEEVTYIDYVDDDEEDFDDEDDTLEYAFKDNFR